mmetsp:Transcript_18414/g.50536  ORF Transcript_18414/g.50536 Transcript_18414/m.50536 type:complete len:349 (-) Transcript_18414:189-1235(-)
MTLAQGWAPTRDRRVRAVHEALASPPRRAMSDEDEAPGAVKVKVIDEDEKPQIKVPDLPTPWLEELKDEEDHAKRIVGWRGGQSLLPQEVKDIMRKDRDSKREYRSLRKHARCVKAAAQYKDPLRGLPPTWKSFWSSVPHLDAQTAYKQYQKEKDKLEKAKKAEAAGGKTDTTELRSDGSDSELEMQNARLKQELREKQQLLSKTEDECKEWDKKLCKIRTLDRDQETRSAKLAKTFEKESYDNGMAQGKRRSSDLYFTYLQQDSEGSHKKQTMNLARSCALLKSQMQEIKDELRLLLHEVKTSASESPGTPKALSTSGQSAEETMGQGESSADEKMGKESSFGTPRS